MSLRSLRSKIFLLVVALLLAVAAFVMLTTQRNVTRTVVNSERHAVSNVMELVLRDAGRAGAPCWRTRFPRCAAAGGS